MASKMVLAKFISIRKCCGTNSFKTVYDNRSRGEKQASARTRDKRACKPTDKELKETRALFRDFGIKTDIPEFKTNAELWNWRSNVIRESC